MKKQKILVIANGIFGKNPGLSGGDVRFLEIVRHWAKDGHEIHLLSSPEAIDICRIFGFTPILHALPGPAESNRMTFIYRALQSILIIPKSLETFTEGIIYSINDSVFDSVPAFRIKRRYPKGLRWAAVVHWLPPFPPWKRKKSTVFNSIMFFVNERISAMLIKYFADRVLAVSDTTKQQLLDFGVNKDKVRSVKCGVNFREVRAIVERVRGKTYDAIFMKRAQPVKGIYDFIDIWKRVLDHIPQAKLLIVGGEGDDEQQLKSAVLSAGLSAHVTFTGYIHSFSEKFTYLGLSRIFVLPSYEENWAIVIGEAMAAGIPVVSYGLKELKTVWNNLVTWVPVGNTRVFADEVVTLLRSERNRKDITSKALTFIQSLEWKTIAKEELAHIV